MNKKIQNDFYKKYTDKVVPELMKEFGIKNPHDLPELKKVVVNMGLKNAKSDKAMIEEATETLTVITGQKPVVTKARKSISNFSIREGFPVGCMVTLRGARMYDFLEELLRIVLPRIRDFSGIKKSFDKNGNMSIGLSDESIFPEINPDKIKSSKGLNITAVIKTDSREKSVRMMELLGFPFEKKLIK